MRVDQTIIIVAFAIIASALIILTAREPQCLSGASNIENAVDHHQDPAPAADRDERRPPLIGMRTGDDEADGARYSAEPGDNGVNDRLGEIVVGVADLCAQQRMAYWTRWIGWFTAIGMGLLAYTLLETNRTARHAEKMLAQQKDTDRRQLRAYVTVEKAQITKFEVGQRIAFEIEFKNRGQTPASKIARWAKYSIVDGLTMSDVDDVSDAWLSTIGDLGPGASFSTIMTCEEELTEPLKAEFEARKISIFIGGKIRYEDAFRQRRETGLRLRFTIDSLARDNDLDVCDDGNQAS